MIWYQRDASWWDNPDTTKPKKWHLMGPRGFALCNTRALLDGHSHTEDPGPGSCKKCKCLEIQSSKEKEG
jgi:hypothetical protein